MDEIVDNGVLSFGCYPASEDEVFDTFGPSCMELSAMEDMGFKKDSDSLYVCYNLIKEAMETKNPVDVLAALKAVDSNLNNYGVDKTRNCSKWKTQAKADASFLHVCRGSWETKTLIWSNLEQEFQICSLGEEAMRVVEILKKDYACDIEKVMSVTFHERVVESPTRKTKEEAW